MLNSFTETARRLIREAHEEAHRRRHRSVGPEHLVVAMMRQREGMALAVLHRLGLQRAAVTEDLEGALARVGAAARPATEIPFSPEAARALERSIQQARYLESNWVGTEHLLLGLLYDEHSLRPAAAQVTARIARFVATGCFRTNSLRPTTIQQKYCDHGRSTVLFVTTWPIFRARSS